jgi:hypothetical protein
MAITVLSGFDDVATDYMLVAATDGKGNTYIAMPIIQAKPGMIICGLRPGTSKPIASCACGAGNLARSRPAASLRGRDKRFSSGFWAAMAAARCRNERVRGNSEELARHFPRRLYLQVENALVDLNGYEAGNGGLCQGKPTAYRDSSTHREV